MSHRVTAAAVQVTAGSRVHMVYQGGIVPAGVDEGTLERLLAKGLIEVLTAEKEAEPDAEAEASAKVEKEAAEKKAAEPKK